jgi:hypothetical protein
MTNYSLRSKKPRAPGRDSIRRWSRQDRDLSGHSPHELWRAVEKELPLQLPPGVTRESVRAELERISKDRASLEELAREHSRRAEQLENAGDIDSALHERKEARRQRLMLRGNGPLSTSIPFRQQVQILQLWQAVTGEKPGYTTPPGLPSGKTIRFFQKAYAFVFRKTVSEYHSKKIIQEFRRRNVFPEKLEGTSPSVIDETKIFIIPASSNKAA